MISFKNINSYSTYESYQRIKKIKFQQALERMSKNNCKNATYQDYLNKKVGFKCCKPGQNCCYCTSGTNANGTNCLNPPAGKICCDCSNNQMTVS